MEKTFHIRLLDELVPFTTLPFEDVNIFRSQRQEMADLRRMLKSYDKAMKNPAFWLDESIGQMLKSYWEIRDHQVDCLQIQYTLLN